MILQKRILQNLDSRSVGRINEIYHDVENAHYDSRHDEILDFEQVFWQEAAERYLTSEEAITCLDYGTGTGFVPATIAGLLKADDSLICCDISTEMLRVCEAKLGQMALACKCLFHPIDADSIPAEDSSVDVMTVNSVLHHLYDLKSFAAECRRVLKPSGLLIVSHEPHRPERAPLACRSLRAVTELALMPKKTLIKMVERLPFLEGILRSMLSSISRGYRRRNDMLAEIARQIRNEKILDFDPTGSEIQQIVDFQAQYGFERRELLEGVFEGFEIVEFQAYCHLGFFTGNSLGAAVEGFLGRRWPDTGREMRFVLRKASYDC